jgi:hypothetical protein
MELMISSAIMAVLILAFSAIISQTQTLVAAAHAEQRLNDLGFALSQQLNKDVQAMAKSGFLQVNTDSLIFTKTGDFESAEDSNIRSTAACVCYMSVDNAAQTTNGILVRASRLLYDGALSTTASDVETGTSLAKLAQDAAAAQSLADDFQNDVDGLSLTLPPNTLDELADLKDVFITDCSFIEFEAVGAASSTGTWKGDAPTAWPIAIKARFKIHDPLAQHEFKSFEFVCPIP